ncbi:hypothetical protein RQP46_005962 [Phenoliferia psychrophenolica]
MQGGIPEGKTALVLTDPYNDFLDPTGKLTPRLSDSLAAVGTIANLLKVVKAARAAKIPIFYSMHHQHTPHDYMGWIYKSATNQALDNSNGFQSTDLEYQLRSHGVTKLVMAGLVANTCLESTARYGYELGYHITMLKDATAAFSAEQYHAATQVVWPLFASSILTTDEWVKTLSV